MRGWSCVVVVGLLRLVVVLAATAIPACGGPGRPSAVPSNSAGASGELTLYRDRALVRQRVELEVPPAGYATVRVTIAAGVDVEDIYVVEHDRFTIRELRQVGAVTPAARQTTAAARGDGALAEPIAEELASGSGDGDGAAGEADGDAAAARRALYPVEVELVIGAPQAGRYVLHLGYLTERITWDAAYTMVATAARDRAVVRGALAIHNRTGIALPGARVRIIDAELGAATRRA
ncbi:MAG: hypothetical protein M3680_24515, partial [Myxococcota bacterium]|nr:hypothetical protein [Myxococcota bacterium]